MRKKYNLEIYTPFEFFREEKTVKILNKKYIIYNTYTGIYELYIELIYGHKVVYIERDYNLERAVKNNQIYKIKYVTLDKRYIVTKIKQ